MKLGIVTGTEDGSTDADHRASAGNRIGVIIGHTHRHTFHPNIIVFFCTYVNRNIAHFFEKFEVISVFLTNWGDCHKSFYPNVRILADFVQGGKNFLGSKTGLAFFAANVDFQQDVLNDALAGGFLVDGGR